MYLGFWKRVLINGIFFIAIAGLYSSGLHVANVWVAFMAAFVLGLLNTFVKPFLIILSLPITLWTMGLFYFTSFSSALIVAIIMSIVNLIVTNYFMNR